MEITCFQDALCEQKILLSVTGFLFFCDHSDTDTLIQIWSTISTNVSSKDTVHSMNH